MYVTLRSFRGSRSATFCPPRSGMSRACRRSRTPTSDVGTVRARHSRCAGHEATSSHGPRAVGCRLVARSLRRAAPCPDPRRTDIRFRTILKIEYVARVFTFTRSLIDSDCVLLRNTRWGTAIAIGELADALFTPPHLHR